MPISRRNTLVGLGALVAGGGAVLATGAFTQVEAQRTVSVDTAGDADAMLGIEAHDEYDVGDDIVELEIENLNLEARTILASPTLVLTNNGTQEVDSISFDIAVDGDVDEVVEPGEVEEDEVGIEFEFVSEYEFDDDDGFSADDGSTQEDETPLEVGESVAYQLIIDTRNSGLDGESEFDLDVTITVEASD